MILQRYPIRRRTIIQNIFQAFFLTLIAGLSTGIGSCIAFLTKHTNKTFFSVSLGFSAGVMIYVSMIEIFRKSQALLIQEFGNKNGNWATVLAFFGGIAFIAIIDRLIPSEDNPHELTAITRSEDASLLRMGIFTATAISVHNIPEGIATFVSALQEPGVAIPIVTAIAIHNIPEGIAVSIPLYQATASRKKSFFFSFLSGLTEPIGALIGWLLLMPILNDAIFGIVFASVAGIMVFISLDELLPSAQEFGHHHESIYGLVGGMAVMALSLLLLM